MEKQQMPATSKSAPQSGTSNSSSFPAEGSLGRLVQRQAKYHEVAQAAQRRALEQGAALGSSRMTARDAAYLQLKEARSSSAPSTKAPENKTGMPDNLKSGIERLSGLPMNDVTVHYNSSKPAQLQAHAYAQGTDIHVAPGQEKHLAHEAWHVVQQKQGRVKPTLQLQGQSADPEERIESGKVNVNDDAGLEKEADVMGEKALRTSPSVRLSSAPSALQMNGNPVTQRRVFIKSKMIGRDYYEKGANTKKGGHGVGDRNVNTMIGEERRKYYFDSKDEMVDYAEERTDDIGYVRRENTWVRLPEGLTVLGENHTETTLMHVVAATGNREFMYEGFTAKPEDASEALSGVMEERYHDIGQSGGIQVNEDSARFYAEDFLPKATRGLIGIQDRLNLGSASISGNPAFRAILKQALIYSQTAPHGSGLETFYQDNQIIIDTSVTDMIAGRRLTMETELIGIFNVLISEFQVLMDNHVQSVRDTADVGDIRDFDAEWKKVDEDFGGEGSPIMNAEKSRDLSMFMHIKAAQGGGYKLYGLGDTHHKRLTALLDLQGIQHMTMGDFLEKQRQKYPQ